MPSLVRTCACAALWIGVGLGAALTSAGTLRADASVRAESKPVTVFAAASLKNVLDAVSQKADGSGEARPVISLAGSSALAKQIEQGAPADVFISADEDWMDYLAERNFILPDTRTPVATNTLALIAPATTSLSVTLAPGLDIAAVLGDGRLAVANVTAVPAGRYAKAALEYLGAWRAVEGKLAQAENVRAALALVARGEAALGIVYGTDARADANVRVIATFPAHSHPPIVYPAAVVTSSASPADAQAFIARLRSPEGQAEFAAHGFGSVK